ncbi:MAG TPA: MAPEG family protein, partial [Polyangiaceae bacterium]|nr:MAPEG family protein [Polyangiaceae bacterium]
LLGFAAWTLSLVLFTIGVPRISAVMSKRAKPSSFDPSVPHGSERYRRCMRAHANCVENLPVFATLVLLGSVLHVEGSPFQIVAALVLPARVLQSVSHIVSGRNRAILARFAFFSVQLTCFFVLIGLLALHGSR